MNKNNHTTSTKCQYHAAQINPMWCLGEKWSLIFLNKQTIKNRIPVRARARGAARGGAAPGVEILAAHAGTLVACSGAA